MDSFRCYCGFTACRSAVEIIRHIERGECPKNPPHDATMHAHWCCGIGHRNFVKPMTEEARQRLRELASDPEYRERKASERKARLELRRRMSMPRGRAISKRHTASLF